MKRHLAAALACLVLCAGAVPSAQRQQPRTGTGRTLADMLARGERWPVKVGADASAAHISLSAATEKTVDELRGLTRPVPDKRYAGAFEKGIRGKRLDAIEKTFIRVDCVILGAKVESSRDSGDRDFHIVIADPADVTHKMIAEIPDPQYIPSSSPFFGMAGQVRAKFLALAAAHMRNGTITSGMKNFDHALPVTIYGVGFWDFSHGQDGLAPNAIEIHPVLRIEER